MKRLEKHPENELNALRVRAIKEPGRYADGGGLYLQVDTSGAKHQLLWVVAEGRRRDIGLGGLAYVCLADGYDPKSNVLEFAAAQRGQERPRGRKQPCSALRPMKLRKRTLPSGERRSRVTGSTSSRQVEPLPTATTIAGHTEPWPSPAEYLNAISSGRPPQVMNPVIGLTCGYTQPRLPRGA